MAHMSAVLGPGVTLAQEIGGKLSRLRAVTQELRSSGPSGRHNNNTHVYSLVTQISMLPCVDVE